MAGLTSQCPTVTITINGREVTALLDTTCEFKTVTETWAAAHVQNRSLQHAYQKPRTVNGTEVPYHGILLVDIEIFGMGRPDLPVLVVEDPH